jgi:transporter family protein
MPFALIISVTIFLSAWGRVVMKKGLEHKPPLVCSLYFALVQFLVAIPFLPWFYREPSTLLYSFLAGSIFSASIWFYFISYGGGEVSLLTPFRGLRGVIALLISFLWWHEAMSAGEIAGVLVIGLGILALYKASEFKRLIHFLFHREAMFMIISVTLGIIASYYDKQGAILHGIYPHYIWTCFFAFLCLLLLSIITYRQRVWSTVTKNVSRHNWIVGAIFAGAYVTHLMALQVERVTIVNAFLAISTLITIFLANRFLKETVVEKLPGTILIVLGTVLMSLAL